MNLNLVKVSDNIMSSVSSMYACMCNPVVNTSLIFLYVCVCYVIIKLSSGPFSQLVDMVDSFIKMKKNNNKKFMPFVCVAQ